jgi:hypothetical protein
MSRSGLWAVAALFAACSSPPPAAPAPSGVLAAAESLYLELRDLRDRIDVAGSAGRTAATDGGLDNLAELLHETGHAIHIAAIRTRPAFADWPDSDPFTEGIADFVALDVTEPAWQQHWLGDSVPLAEGLRARYGDGRGPRSVPHGRRQLVRMGVATALPLRAGAADQ